MKKSVKCPYSKCKIPKEVVEFINQNKSSSYCGLEYVDIVDIIGNEPCLRTFCYKTTKNKGTQVKELGREFLNKTYISDDLGFTNLSGYTMLFENDAKKYYGYVTEATGKLHKCDGLYYPNIHRQSAYTVEELEKAFKPFIPYLDLRNCESILECESVIGILRKYKEHDCEMLIKLGVPYLIKFMKSLRKLDKKKLINWITNNKKYIQEFKPKFSFIRKAIKLNKTAGEYEFYCLNISNQAMLAGSDFVYTMEETEEITKYLLKQNSDVRIYRDYISFSNQLGRNIQDRGVRFPRNLIEQHDSLKEKLDRNKTKLINKALKSKKTILDKYATTYKGLAIVVPKSQQDLVKLGNKLHNCVGTYGYGKKMADGKCIILAIYLNGKPVECCELVDGDKGKPVINQLYGDHNQKSEHHENAEKLVNKFIKSFKQPSIAQLGAA